MRNSYSSGAADVMLEHELFFGSVYGLSAGATNAVNYLSRDTRRSQVSFTDYTDDFSFRKILHPLLRVRGSSLCDDAHTAWAESDKNIPFDYQNFVNNPAHLTLSVIDRDSGETRYLTKDDFTSEEMLMTCVRASTSYPILMPPIELDGHTYYDGGIGEGGGIMLSRAERDGFEHFFVVSTRPKGYRKPLRKNRLYDIFFWHRPRMRHALDTWAVRYNRELDKLEQLEAEGRAYVFYAADQSVSNSERNVAKLKENYNKGYAQALNELSAWKTFLT